MDDLKRIRNGIDIGDRVPHARLIVVEDLSSAVIEALGSKFDIDPRYFRTHFGDYAWFNIRDPWVELPELASAWRQRSFFSIRYARPTRPSKRRCSTPMCAAASTRSTKRAGSLGRSGRRRRCADGVRHAGSDADRRIDVGAGADLARLEFPISLAHDADRARD